MRLFVPGGYELGPPGDAPEPHIGTIATPDGEPFILSNRSWEAVDEYLGGLPRRALAHMLATRRKREAVVALDIAAGAQGRAMTEVQQGLSNDRLHVVGVDIVTDFDTTPPNKLVADATKLPLADGSVDVAYSVQSLSLAADAPTAERRNVAVRGIAEALRVLKPNGVFFIDLDLKFDRRLHQESGLPPITIPENVEVYTLDREVSLGRYAVGTFLMCAMIKQEGGWWAGRRRSKLMHALDPYDGAEKI